MKNALGLLTESTGWTTPTTHFIVRLLLHASSCLDNYAHHFLCRIYVTFWVYHLTIIIMRLRMQKHAQKLP